MTPFDRAILASAIGGLITFAVLSGFGAQTIVGSPLDGEIQGNLFGDVCARLSCIRTGFPNGVEVCVEREYVPRCYATGYVPSALQLQLSGLTIQEPALVTAQPTDYQFSPQATVPPEILTLACGTNELLVNGGCVDVTPAQMDDAVVDYNDNANKAAILAFLLLSAGAFYFLKKRG